MDIMKLGCSCIVPWDGAAQPGTRIRCTTHGDTLVESAPPLPPPPVSEE
jgi:hypothetical protein